MTAPTTQIDGAKMTDEWRTAFDDRHEFDVYPEHFMSGLRNEFAAGWHAAMKSQAHALLASKQAIGCAVDGDEIGAIRKASELMCAMGYTADASQITCFLARVARAYPTAPAQPCGEDAANGAMPASYDAWLRQERSRRADFTPLADSWARSAWKACVALTAANGAMGEREAFEAWGNETFNYGFQPETWDDGAGPVAREAQYTHEGTQMAWEGWQARAALTAEKVAGQEPVGEVTATALEGADRGVIGWYGDPLPVKSVLYAAPQQPAQSAEQDERDK